MDCSAAAYFFAQQLTETLHLPVGLVINSWGGSRIEAWMTEEALAIRARRRYREPPKVLNWMYEQPASGVCMISCYWPVKNYTARGFLWYQGESNHIQLSDSMLR